MNQHIKVVRPHSVYAHIQGEQYRRIYVVGDIHGHLHALYDELDQVGFAPDMDLVISTGDIIDRGPDSLGCLELIRQPWFTAVRGNHEDLASASLRESGYGNASAIWHGNGGRWIGRLRDKALLHRAIDALMATEQWPYVIEVQTTTEKVVISHACYPYPTYYYGQPIDMTSTVWDRARWQNRLRGIGLYTDGADLFVHGHIGMKEPTRYGNHMYIDTHWMSGRLTLLRIQ